MSSKLYWGGIDAHGAWVSDGGMGKAIEDALAAVTPFPPGADVMSRRKALIAIAQGVILYLGNHADAIEVTVGADGYSTTTTAAIAISVGP
jgi:hypothetical protein